MHEIVASSQLSLRAWPVLKVDQAWSYVKNMPEDADKLFLYEKFAPFGAIHSVKVGNEYVC
eukprot:171963-Pelagomonas_calceolata.AAC.1